MKYLSLIVLQLMALTAVFCQSGPGRQSLMWEISGNGLSGLSYLYGSAHLNDTRIFELDDSLYYALTSCKQFAAEIDFSRIDSILTIELQKEFLSEEQDTTDVVQTTDEEETDIFDEMDATGRPTFLDAYLYRAAMNQGLSSHGLEDTEEQLGMIDALAGEKRSYPRDRQDSFYNAVVESYARGDLEALQNIFGKDGFEERLMMIKRNHIQADAFEALAQQSRTFAVVGAGHLFGKENVLELLRARGYHIRRVGFGERSNGIDSLYALTVPQDWHQLQSTLYNYELASNLNNELATIYEQGEYHLSFEVDKGLAYMSMVFPATVVNEQEFIDFAKTTFFPDTLELREVRETIGDGDLIRYNFTNTSEELAFRARIQTGRTLYTLQLIIGFSISALQHPHVERYLNGLTIQDPPDQKWATQYAPEGAFHYLFPGAIPFKENPIDSERFSERGQVIIRYKTYTDPESQDEYLVRYHCMPPGITHLDPPNDLEATVRFLADVYNSRLDQTFLINEDGNPGMEASMTDSLNNVFYAKCMIRGAMMYILVQKSIDGERDKAFFDALTLDRPAFALSNVFQYPPASFSINAPAESYHYTETEAEQTVVSYEFNIEGSGVTMILEFHPFNRYEEANLHDSIFTIDNLIDTTAIDTLLHFSTFKFGEVCPAYIVRYEQDSMHYFRTEVGIFCNDHFTNVEFIAPLQLRNETYVDQLFKTIDFTVDEQSISSMTARKAPLILTDLQSRDTSLFSAALPVFADYEYFTEEDLPAILALLDQPLIYDEWEYNAKSIIVGTLKDFATPLVVERLADYYLRTEKRTIKAGILEILGLGTTEASLSHLFRLLEQSPPEQVIPARTYRIFTDSLELMEKYYPRLKQLAVQGKGKASLLPVLSHWLEQDSTYAFLEADDQWIRSAMYEQIDSFYVALETDSSASIDAYLMDYLLEKGTEDKVDELFAVIAASKEVFGAYRIIYHKLARQQAVPDTLLTGPMSNDYYRYWVMDAYAHFERELPEEWTDKLEVAQTVMKHYVYTNYDFWCSSCALVQEIPKGEIQYGNMLYLQCDAAEEGQYYLGCIGPFDDQGQFQISNEESIYYSTPQPEENFAAILEELIEYLNNE